MKTQSRRVTSVLAGSEITSSMANFAICEDCGGDLFYVFQVEGQDHFHLLCLTCEVCYCPQGACGQ